MPYPDQNHPYPYPKGTKPIFKRPTNLPHPKTSPKPNNRKKPTPTSTHRSSKPQAQDQPSVRQLSQPAPEHRKGTNEPRAPIPLWAQTALSANPFTAARARVARTQNRAGDRHSGKRIISAGRGGGRGAPLWESRTPRHDDILFCTKGLGSRRCAPLNSIAAPSPSLSLGRPALSHATAPVASESH